MRNGAVTLSPIFDGSGHAGRKPRDRNLSASAHPAVTEFRNRQIDSSEMFGSFGFRHVYDFSCSRSGGSITPVQPTVSVSAGTPVTLNIGVTEDDPSDVLTATCAAGSGSFGEISGTAGSGVYTVQFSPTPATTLTIIDVSSRLSNSTQGTTFVMINP